MALGVSRHAEVIRRFNLPQASRPVAAPQSQPESVKTPNSSNVPPSSPADSLFDGSDGDDSDVPKLALNDAAAGTDSTLASESALHPPVLEPTSKQVSATSLSPEISTAGVPNTTPSERTRPVKGKGKGKDKGKGKGKVAATAPKPNSTQDTSSRPPVALSSKQQAAYYVTKKTPSWAGGQGNASTLIPGNASVLTSTTPGPANSTALNDEVTRKAGRPVVGANRTTIQPSSGPTAHSTLNQPSDASISSAPPTDLHTRATQSIPPNKFVSTDRVTSVPAASSLPGSSSSQIPPTPQTSRTPSASQYAIPPPNTSANAAGPTTATVGPDTDPTTARSTIPPSVANTSTTSLPRYTANGRFPPTIPVCTVPAHFTSPPPPSLCLPPPRVFHNFTPAQLAQIAQAQNLVPFPTQPAPLSCVSPTWLSGPLPRRSASIENIQRAQTQRGTPQAPAGPAVPLRRAASEQIMRSPQVPVHAHQVQGAYSQISPAQPAGTRQVHVQPGQYTNRAASTRPVPSTPVAQVAPKCTPRVASASKLSQSHIPPPAQNYAPRANNGDDSFSADAWRANSPMIHPPPLVRAQSCYGYPATQPPPVQRRAMAGPSHQSTAPAIPSNLSYVYTRPPPSTVHKRRVEEEDDEIQEIPPPHKRFRGQ